MPASPEVAIAEKPGRAGAQESGRGLQAGSGNVRLRADKAHINGTGA